MKLLHTLLIWIFFTGSVYLKAQSIPADDKASIMALYPAMQDNTGPLYQRFMEIYRKKKKEAWQIFLSEDWSLTIAKEAATGTAPNPPYPNTPFVNSLGMEFVLLPTTNAAICTHETRVQDYDAYASAEGDTTGSWKLSDVMQDKNYPAVGISWSRAKLFCDWLSKHENRRYRMISDREWSVAIGLGPKEDPKLAAWSFNTFLMKQMKQSPWNTQFLWGPGFPPPAGTGNFAGEESAAQRKIPGYRDEHPQLAPVKSYRANPLGIYDLEGNVREWCMGRVNQGVIGVSQDDYIYRGCGFTDGIDPQHTLLFGFAAAYRSGAARNTTSNALGFRCVIVLEGDTTEEVN